MLEMKLVIARFRKDGQLIERREQVSRSWLKHFFDVVYPMHSSAQLLTINDIGGVARTISALSTASVPNLSVGSPPGNIQMVLRDGGAGNTWAQLTQWSGDTIGIVVGTNALAVTPIQDALQAKVTHGEGAGQLLYGGCELFGLTFANPNGQFTIRRYFTNVLGGAIGIQEVGIYSPAWSSVNNAYIFCIARDVVAPAVTVANTEILRVTYVPQITV